MGRGSYSWGLALDLYTRMNRPCGKSDKHFHTQLSAGEYRGFGSKHTQFRSPVALCDITGIAC